MSHNVSRFLKRGMITRFLVKRSRRAFVTSTPTGRPLPKLLDHWDFIDTSKEEGSQYLGLFVGRNSDWRLRGLPWKLYKPWYWGVGLEISKMDALERLSNNQPVKFQRMRVVTVTPDLKALESLALPGVAKLVSTAKTAQVAADPEGLEIRNGIPTTIRSLAELKLFAAIYVEEMKLPENIAIANGFGDHNSKIVNEQIQIANNISDLMSRKLESGLDFFTDETNILRRFAYHIKRQTLFWAPLCLVTAYALSSTSLMRTAGVDPYFFLPPALLQEVSSNLPEFMRVNVDGEVPDVTLRESSLGICGGVLSAYVPSRSFFLSLLTPLGFRLTAYEAFCRIARREPTVFQEVKMHTMRVPFFTTLSWFTNYRPGDIIDSPQELEKFHRMQLMDVKQLTQK